MVSRGSGGVGREDADDGGGDEAGPWGKTIWTACALLGGFAQIAGGMRGEGRQVVHHRQVGLTPAPVSEIVLQVIPVGLGRVEGPVPDPPSGASSGGDFGHIIACGIEVGNEAVAAGPLAVGFGDPDLRPGDAERIGHLQSQDAHIPSPYLQKQHNVPVLNSSQLLY